MSFRRVVIALAALALFASLASAQVNVSQKLNCSVSAFSSPSLRAEGVTELVGDMKLQCSGGPVQTGASNDLGKVQVSVDYGVPVTSRVIGTATTDADGVTHTPVEAVLTVDEPSATAAVGIQNVCVFGGACAANVVVPAAPGTPETISGANVFQGYILSSNPNQVVFDNVPVLALGNTSFNHVYRVTNVYVTPSSSSVVATVSTKEPTGNLVGVTLTSNTATVGTPASSLATSYVAPGISICSSAKLDGSVGNPNLGLLTFAEKFNKAFRTQAGESGATVTTIAAANDAVANSGTRLKAVFTGLNTSGKVTYYVSVANVADAKTPATTTRAQLLPQTLTNPETQLTGTYATGTANAWGAGPSVVPLLVSSTGTAEAVWEVTSPDNTNLDNLVFSMYATIDLLNAPAPSAAPTIQMGYAPTAKSTGAASTWIPRFQAPAAATSFAPILPCQTTLLFPYLTNSQGYETGIAISNTSLDPFSTSTSTGTCSLIFYGPNGNTVTTDAVAAGATYANTVSGLGLVNFSGYMIGVCNFQFAHGFSYIVGGSGSSSTAMGYLALVLNDTGRGATLIGESSGM